MNPNKALWEKGDFTRIASGMRESGEALVARLGVTKGAKVLDLGCGDGTTALPAAKLGADVLGVDISSPLVAAGNRRAQSRAWRTAVSRKATPRTWRGWPTRAFDLVVSIFGAMFAPKPFDVAKEMVRVTKPGGRSSWATGFPGRSDPGGADSEDQLGLYAAAARRFCQSDDLGRREQRARALRGAPAFRRRRSRASATPTSSTFRGRRPTFVAVFRNYYGPTMNAFEAAEKNGKAEDLRKELDTLFTAKNQSKDPKVTSIPATFLRVTVSVG